jgi:mono/diheme cytochrome c family protein
MKLLGVVTFSVALVTLPLSGQARDLTIGQAEYMNSCAQCHGAGGKGDGIIAGYLNAAMPDLTQIQKNNDGVFPVTRMYATIEGNLDIGAHGSSEMPAWGLRYSKSAPEMLGLYYGPYDQEVLDSNFKCNS